MKLIEALDQKKHQEEILLFKKHAPHRVCSIRMAR